MILLLTCSFKTAVLLNNNYIIIPAVRSICSGRGWAAPVSMDL
jgi:hypothetical protein